MKKKEKKEKKEKKKSPIKDSFMKFLTSCSPVKHRRVSSSDFSDKDLGNITDSISQSIKPKFETPLKKEDEKDSTFVELNSEKEKKTEIPSR